MTVEVSTYISGLNITLPTGTDPVAQGDDHLRLLKSVLKNTFPTLNAALSASLVPFTPAGVLVSTQVQAAIAELEGVAAAKAVPSLTVAKDTATGAASIPVGTTGERPAAPTKGQFRYNDTLDVFEGYTEGVGWGQVGGGQMLGAATTKAIFYNSQTISENISIGATQNAGSFGPITIADGFTVEVVSGAVWSVV